MIQLLTKTSKTSKNLAKFWNIWQSDDKVRVDVTYTEFKYKIDNFNRHWKTTADRSIEHMGPPRSREYVRMSELSGHSRSVYTIAWNCSGKYLASGSTDKGIRVWDVKSVRSSWDFQHYCIIIIFTGKRISYSWIKRTHGCDSSSVLGSHKSPSIGVHCSR